MDRFIYRVEEISIEQSSVAVRLEQLLNEPTQEWEAVSVGHLRDDGTTAVFLLVWRQPRPFGDLAE